MVLAEEILHYLLPGQNELVHTLIDEYFAKKAGTTVESHQRSLEQKLSPVKLTLIKETKEPVKSVQEEKAAEPPAVPIVQPPALRLQPTTIENPDMQKQERDIVPVTPAPTQPIQPIQPIELAQPAEAPTRAQNTVYHLSLEGKKPRFFDETDGIYQHLVRVVIPFLKQRAASYSAKAQGLRINIAGGGSLYEDGYHFYYADLIAVLLKENGIDDFTIIVTGTHQTEFQEGQKAVYNLEWFICGHQPLTEEYERRIMQFFDDQAGNLQLKRDLRNHIRVEYKRLADHRIEMEEAKFDLIVYAFIEYRVEQRTREDNLLETNIIAGSNIDNLKVGGWYLTTAEDRKFNGSSWLIQRILEG